MDISIIIVSFNTKDITLQCVHELDLLFDLSPSVKSEVIVVDNASTDGSANELAKISMAHAQYSFIGNATNMGFSKANNVGLAKATGRYVLFLNSDVMVSSTARPINFSKLLEHMDSLPNVGALTVRVELPDGKIDPACHRGFPTPWRSLTYFLKAEALMEKLHITHRGLLTIFGSYHLLGEDMGTQHVIDSGTGAFLLSPRRLVDELKGFDEQFFMYGEDLDLCYRMKEKGYQVVWYPSYTVTHLKYQSGLQSRDTSTKQKIRWHFYDAMERFYRKHYEKKSCPCINIMILTIIRLIKRKFFVE